MVLDFILQTSGLIGIYYNCEKTHDNAIDKSKESKLTIMYRINILFCKSKAYGFGFQITDISFDWHLLQLQKNMWIVPLIESKENKLTLKKKKCVIVVFDKGEEDIYRSCETYKTFSVFRGKS